MGLNSTNLLIDANVWVSYLDKDDDNYGRAGKLIRQCDEPNLLLLTDYILQEVITIFLHKKKSVLIDELMKLINRESYIEVLSVDGLLLSKVLRFISVQNYSPKMSLTDWSLLYLADEFDCKLVTFDRQLKNTHRRLGARRRT